jgi:predicted deacylase
MESWQLGSGTPKLAIVAGIHGDEPSGVQALRRLRNDPPTVDRPVKCIVANEEALERGVRFVDEDLNRVFPGDPDADTHEGRLAAKLLDELDGALTLSLHSTQSHPEPFALVAEVTSELRPICARLPVEAVVESGEFTDGRLLQSVPTIEVECGLQGSDEATANATRVIDAFLAATGASGEPLPQRELPVLRLRRRIPKDPTGEHAVHVENLGPVEAGEAYATVDEQPAVAEDAFYPVLMSANGYEHIFGYEADRVGTIAPGN